MQLFSDDTPIINEYFQKKECKEIIDRIIANAGGEENIKKATSSTYEVFINLNLIDLKISYKQLVKRLILFSFIFININETFATIIFTFYHLSSLYLFISNHTKCNDV